MRGFFLSCAPLFQGGGRRGVFLFLKVIIRKMFNKILKIFVKHVVGLIYKPFLINLIEIFQGGSVPTQNSARIKWIVRGRRAEVFVPRIEIDQGHPVCFPVRIRKLPLPQIPSKGKFFLHTVPVDPEEAFLAGLIKYAASLGNLPEERRIDILLNKVKELMRYPFPGLIEELDRENPEEAHWIQDHFHGSNVFSPLSAYLERGYGKCSQYAALFALLAQAAGLGVILAFCLQGSLVNFVRQDTKQPLFSTVPLGQVDTGHAWNEVRMRNGEWVTIDPTKSLNGLDLSHREIFAGANYSHLLGQTIRVRIDKPAGNKMEITIPKTFRPGQEEIEGLLRIGLSTQPKLTLEPGKKMKEVCQRSFPYRGSLSFVIDSVFAYEDDLIGAAYADAEISLTGPA